MKSKILFLLHLPPPVHGSSMVGEFIKKSKLIKNSFETRYINLGTSTAIDQIGKGRLRKLLKFIQIVTQTIFQCLFYKPKIGYLAIAATGPAFYKDLIIAFLIKLSGAQLVLHFHNKGISKHQNNCLIHFLYKQLFKDTKVILLSELLYYDVQKYVNRKDTYYCPNGIPEIKVLNNLVKKKSSTVNILFLSNLIESKGIFVLLKALNLLKKRQLNFRCNVVGGEGDINVDKLNEKLELLNLKKEVIYLGKKYGNEKEEVFLNADIFAFPTFYHFETFGIVNIEAMMYGLPVISTNEGAIPEIVENQNTGFIVSKNNVNELADAIEILIKDPAKRLQMGQAGKKKFKEKYTLTKFENTFNSILNGLC